MLLKKALLYKNLNITLRMMIISSLQTELENGLLARLDPELWHKLLSGIECFPWLFVEGLV